MISSLTVNWLEFLVSLPHFPIPLILDQFMVVPFAETFAVAIIFSGLQQILQYQHVILAVLLQKGVLDKPRALKTIHQASNLQYR